MLEELLEIYIAYKFIKIIFRAIRLISAQLINILFLILFVPIRALYQLIFKITPDPSQKYILFRSKRKIWTKLPNGSWQELEYGNISY